MLENQDWQLSEDIDAVGRTALHLAGEGSLELLQLMNVAERLGGAGEKDLLKEVYRTWLQKTTAPASYQAVACFNFAVLLSGDGDSAGAERINRLAIQLNPELLQARLNLSNNLEALGRSDESVDLLRSVLENESVRQPENRKLLLHTFNNLGRILEGKRNFKAALEYLEQSLTADPTQTDVLLHFVHLRQKQCIWPLFSPYAGIGVEEMIRGTSPLAMLAAYDDPEVQYDGARRFVEYKYRCPFEPLAPPSGYNHRKIRIGYLSSDFCLHAVSLLTVQLFELHDRDRFETYAFCWSKEDPTYLRERVVAAFDHFIRVKDMDDRAAAECIRSNEIDILVDLHGLTSGARPPILAHRPAPVQATYLGFPGTTGLPWIDYVVADRYLIPEEEVRWYTEKPLYLPNCFQVSDAKRPIGATPTRAENGLPEKGFVFCAFNNNYKFTPELFALWMRILQRVPGSVLWLLADNEWSKENLLNAAKKHGIKSERLVFASRVAPADYLARYRLADLFLDTYPFNGGTTANDALFMGLPLLTLSGRTFASRMAGSLLTDLGLPELITTSLKEYEKAAVSLAKQPKKLAELKARLDGNRLSANTFNIPNLVKQYEDALLGVLVRDQNLLLSDGETGIKESEAPMTQLPVQQGDVINLLNMIRPWNIASDTKIRVGSDADGGYVLPSCARASSLVFSIGVGEEVSFDSEMANQGAQVLQFDHTIGGAPLQHPNIRYYRLGWGARDDEAERLISLRTMMSLADWTGARCPILKFDTEGAEWECLLGADPADLARFQIITGEFHDFPNLVNRADFDRVHAVFELLSRTHKVVHLHANNAGGLFIIGGIPFPRLLELTWLRKDTAIFAGHSTEPIPGPLDRPNVPQIPDLYLRAF